MKIITSLFLSIFILSCAQNTDLLKSASSVLQNSQALSNGDIVSGLKEALSLGAANSVNLLSAKNGYLNSAIYKVPFPPEAVIVEKTLRSIGMTSLVDKTVTSLNRAAEAAAIEAKPIFMNAIKNMSIDDAKNILLGSNNAATSYFQNNTQTQLLKAFTPVIQKKLNTTNATQYWGDVISKYNQIPLMKKVNPDLTNFVAQKAISGLFISIAQEEEKIRSNPMLRSSTLLKRVFALADSQKTN